MVQHGWDEDVGTRMWVHGAMSDPCLNPPCVLPEWTISRGGGVERFWCGTTWVTVTMVVVVIAMMVRV